MARWEGAVAHFEAESALFAVRANPFDDALRDVGMGHRAEIAQPGKIEEGGVGHVAGVSVKGEQERQHAKRRRRCKVRPKAHEPASPDSLRRGVAAHAEAVFDGPASPEFIHAQDMWAQMPAQSRARDQFYRQNRAP